AVLYHLITGETPFNGETVAVVLMQHMTDDMPSPRVIDPALPASVARLTRTMTALDPAQRYQTCAEVCDDIERVLKGEQPRGLLIHAGETEPHLQAANTPQIEPTVVETSPPSPPVSVSVHSREPVKAGI